MPHPSDPLFLPGQIGALRLPNRLIRSATAERLADNDGLPGPALPSLYSRLVRGGVGLIVTGHAYIDRAGRCHHEMTAADRDEAVPALARLAETVHADRGRIALQINHGGRGCDPTATPVRSAPSPTPREVAEGCRELAGEEILGLVARFAAAGERARAAGFDAVQVHGAHGYLVSQLLSPLTNRRTDEWGGSPDRRARFLLEVGRALRARLGPDYPILVKLGVRDYEPGGLSLEEGLGVVTRLADAGFDGVEISHGIGGPPRPRRRPGLSAAEREAPFLDLARRARQVTHLPLILVNGLRSREAMAEVIEGGAADFVALCRPLICEPDLPARIRDGETARARCRTCDNCWPKGTGEGVACRCPALAR
jgi:2,4-dienoyl-CoA reductase-like NADH-dependent reductase (Old Yellow Enzyme family)